MRARKRSQLAAATALLAGFAALRAGDPGTGDWPMWGGSPERNMTRAMKGLPKSWDIEKGTNIAWVAAVGSQTYGNPTVAGGRIFVGTNNEGMRDKALGGDRGVLMAFQEKDGVFLWQHATEKLAAGRVNDWPFQGVASSPLIIGDRLYYVNNRAELLCLDVEGFHDGENDGPYKDEKLTGKGNADIVWKLDMMDELAVFPHNLANASPVPFGDLILLNTSNGHDESHVHIPSPRAPALIAVNRNTGAVAWEDNRVGEKILHGQWSSPAVGKVGGIDMVVSAQGDGYVRGYEAATGKFLWEFDTNPKDSVWPKNRNEVISTPVILNDRVYLANGQDPEHGEGVGHLYCIDPTKRGDITKTGLVWHYDKIRRSISTGALADGILYYADFSGFLHAIDAATGKPYWVHDMLAAVWASPYVVDGKVYLGDEDGDVVVLQHGKTKEVLAEVNMGSSVYGTFIAANGRLYVTNRNQLIAIQEGAKWDGKVN